MVENCCVFVLLCEGEQSSESGLLLLLMGRNQEKLRKEKIRAPCENFFLPGFFDLGWAGLHAFETARDAFLRWQQFDLGWVQVVNPSAKIMPGQLVGVEAHTACLWSVSLNRVVEIVDSQTRFGFMYAATPSMLSRGKNVSSSTSIRLPSQCPTSSKQYPVQGISSHA